MPAGLDAAPATAATVATVRPLLGLYKKKLRSGGIQLRNLDLRWGIGMYNQIVDEHSHLRLKVITC